MNPPDLAPSTKEQKGVAAVAAVLTIAFLSATGCFRTTTKHDATVSGTVTVDGELAPRGTVTFHPVDGGPVSIGHINSGGSYSLRTGQGNLNKTDGGTVQSGNYIVTAFVNLTPVEKDHVNRGGPPVPGVNIADVKYRSRKTSPLRHLVKPGRNVIILNLDREPVAAETVDSEEVLSTETTGNSPAAKSSKPEASPQPIMAASRGATNAANLQPEVTEEATP